MHVKCVHGADLQDCSYSNCTLALSILQAAFTASDGSQKNEIQPLYHHHFFEGFEFQNQLDIPTPCVSILSCLQSQLLLGAPRDHRDWENLVNANFMI